MRTNIIKKIAMAVAVIGMLSTCIVANAEEAAVSAPVQNVPVGNNPILDQYGYEIWIFTDGSSIIAAKEEGYDVIVNTDAYGVTYRNLTSVLTNEDAMRAVATFMQNPNNAKAAETIQNCGRQLVIVTCRGLWDEESDYTWGFKGVDCEPDDCIYFFITEEADEDTWNEMLTAFQDSNRSN